MLIENWSFRLQNEKYSYINCFLVDSNVESDEELNKTIDRELAKKGGLSTLLASDETPKQTAEDIFAEAAAKGRSVRM